MTKARAGRPERVGDILRERIGALGWESRLREEEVLEGWDAVVGPQIAAHARASHIANRRLTVVTESPVWTQQLAFLRADLLRRLGRHFGAEAITELFFVTGPMPAAAPTPAPAAPAAAPRALPGHFERDLAAIGDTDVREAVRRLILASLADTTGA